MIDKLKYVTALLLSFFLTPHTTPMGQRPLVD